jgi:hypothetical protein
VDELDRWAAGRAEDLIARAEAEAVAELKAALLRAAAVPSRTGAAPTATPQPTAAPEPAVAAEATASPQPAAAGTAPTVPPAPTAATAATMPPAPAASPEGDALWAYCVARDDAALAGGGPGVHPDGALQWVREAGLALLCSRVPLAEFGEEPLRHNLNDLHWLERTARAHEAAIGAAFAQAPVVPLRLCTIFADEAGARRMLEERSEPLARAISTLEGREEFSVKLLVDRDRLADDLRGGEAPAEAGSGAAYLLLRREERRLREAVADRAARLAEDVHARLQERAVDARVRPPQNRELSGHEGDMVLNGAYLVERDQADGLRALVEELRARHGALGARIELGGPFPPYSFVPEAE